MSAESLGLTDREAMALFGLKPTRFYQLKKTLAPHCMSPIDGVWSRERIAAYMAQPPKDARPSRRIPFMPRRTA